jgi:hypothetical protein
MAKKKGYYTQWASQFYVAAELTRRKHLVSLTFGNAEEIDILAVNPKGTPILIDVKGQSAKGFWLIRRREARSNYFFVFVYIPPDPATKPTFWVMSSQDAMRYREEREMSDRKSGGKYREELGGFTFVTPLPHENKWEILES